MEKTSKSENTNIIISNIEDTMDDVLLVRATHVNSQGKRKIFAGCEECDIPFSTKKDLKVNFLLNSIK